MFAVFSGFNRMEVGDSETNAWKKVSDSFPRSCCILSVNAGGNEIIDTLDQWGKFSDLFPDIFYLCKRKEIVKLINRQK